VDELDWRFSRNLLKLPPAPKPDLGRELMRGDLALAREAAFELLWQLDELLEPDTRTEGDPVFANFLGKDITIPCEEVEHLQKKQLADLVWIAIQEREHVFFRPINNAIREAAPILAATKDGLAKAGMCSAPSLALALLELYGVLAFDVYLSKVFDKARWMAYEVWRATSPIGSSWRTWEVRRCPQLGEDAAFCEALADVPLDRFRPWLKAHMEGFEAWTLEACLEIEFSRAAALRLQLELMGSEPSVSGAGPGSMPEPTNLEDNALAVLLQHPDWTNIQIAEELSCNPKSLSRKSFVRFRAARAAQAEGRSDIQTGFRDLNGNVDAAR
jgi:hypothetical protein